MRVDKTSTDKNSRMVVASFVRCGRTNLLRKPIFGPRGRVAAVIAELGVSQASFAQSIGRSREPVNAWVTGRRTSDHESARRIAAIVRAGLGLDVEGEHFHSASSAPLDDIRVQVEQLAKQLAAEPRRGPTMFLALLEINRPTRRGAVVYRLGSARARSKGRDEQVSSRRYPREGHPPVRRAPSDLLDLANATAASTA